MPYHFDYEYQINGAVVANFECVAEVDVQSESCWEITSIQFKGISDDIKDVLVPTPIEMIPDIAMRVCGSPDFQEYLGEQMFEMGINTDPNKEHALGTFELLGRR